ncbi:MAG: spore coat U domain-containing protein [Steroidobacteraceae bacterium]
MSPPRRRQCLAQLGLLVVCGLLTAPARATITGNCTASATGVSFGTYSLLSGTPLTSTGTVTVNCSGATKISGNNSVTVSLSTGQSGTFTARSLGTGFSYNLYQDAAYSEIWGDGTGVSTQYTGSITNGQNSFSATVYGEIPARQNPAPGSYTDSITVTVNY